jgi:hypothetical protein
MSTHKYAYTGPSVVHTPSESRGIELCPPNYCMEGYYCPSASTQQYQCGNPGVFCPTGSGSPSVVTEGFYSISKSNMDLRGIVLSEERRQLTRSGQLICEAGFYCLGGIRRECPIGTYGNTTGLSSPLCSGPCLSGHYCPLNTKMSGGIPCPAGRYGNTAGLTDSACTGLCDAGEIWICI